MASGNKSIYGNVSEDNRLIIKIINLNTKDEVDIYYTQPDSISDPYNANFEEKPIIGRSTPLLVYSGGSSRGINFTLEFHEDYLGEETNILKLGSKIKSMSFPVYDGFVKSPKVYVKIGKMYSFWGVMNTDIKYHGPVRNGRMIMATIDFKFTRIGNVVQSGYLDYNGDSTVDSAQSVREEWKFGGR